MTFTVVINVFNVVISFYTNHHDCSPSLVRHITVQSSASFTVRIGWPIQLSKTFSCLFLLSFMLTLPLHEVMIPLFFAFCFLFLNFFFTNGSCPSLYFFFSILSHLPFSLFYFLDLFAFWRQQVGIDQGDIPDLSQVSVHLTFHLFFIFLTLAPILASPPTFSALFLAFL